MQAVILGMENRSSLTALNLKKLKTYVLNWFSIAIFLLQLFIYGCSPPVATVNGKQITVKEFRYTLEHTYGAQVVRWLITKKLLEEENERLKLVSEADVDRALDDFKARLGGEAQFQLWLRRNNRTENDVREDLERDLIMFRLRASKVSEKQLKAFYERNKQFYQQPPTVKIAVVASRKKEDIEKAKKELEDGKSFGVVARRYSDIRYIKATGGDIGNVPNGYYRLPTHVWSTFYSSSPEAFEIVRNFNADIWRAINQARKEELIGPIHSNGIWFLVKVFSKTDARQLQFEEVREELLTRYLNEVGPSESEIESELWRKAKIQIHWAEYKPLEDIYKEAEWMKLEGEKESQPQRSTK